jgi:secreted PhoX family phosphatase
MIALSPNGRYLFTPSEAGASDGITRLTLKGDKAGTKEILAQNVDSAGKPVWSRIDGIKWYPYGGPRNKGVLLASEEFNDGGVWQVNPDTGAFVRLSWIGNYAHEGIGLDKAGNLYLGDENRAGAIYKAVPNDPSDLTKGGALYYLVGTGTDASGWKKVVDPAKAISEALTGGAVLFDRPEDFDERNGRVYFAVTEPLADAAPRKGTAGQLVNEGGIYSLNTTGVPDLARASGSLPYNRLTPMIKVNDPKYATKAEAQAQQGLQFPDNIAFDRYGHLWVQEDIPDSNGSFPASGVDVGKQTRDQQDELYVFVLNKAGDALVANPDASGPGVSGGYKAADMRSSAKATPCENELSGGIFGRDGTLYINQQHADNPTLAVSFDDESEGDS